MRRPINDLRDFSDGKTDEGKRLGITFPSAVARDMLAGQVSSGLRSGLDAGLRRTGNPCRQGEGERLPRVARLKISKLLESQDIMA
jgi:hypothetical protein